MSEEITKVMTPPFRVSFPFVFEPKDREKKRKGQLEIVKQYEVKALIPKTASFAELKNFIKATAVKRWGQNIPKNLKMPFLDGNRKDLEKYPEFKDVVDINLTSTRKPGLVNAQSIPILEPSEFYAGCWARAKVNCYAYGGPGTDYAPGVSFGLNNIQKLSVAYVEKVYGFSVEDDSFGGGGTSAEDDFDPVESTDTSGVDADMFADTGDNSMFDDDDL